MIVSRQEVFDIVLRHARKQMKRSLNAEGCMPRCMYRNPEGLKCFIGCLIPNAAYDPSWEGSICHIQHRLRALGLACVTDSFGSELQGIHDAYQPSHWEEQLEAFAKKHGLIYRRLDKQEPTVEAVCP